MPFEKDKFNLTTPEADANGDPITHQPPHTTNYPYVEWLNNFTKVRLIAPVIGPSTQNSNRVRNEFREINPAQQYENGDYVPRNTLFGSEPLILRTSHICEKLNPNGRYVWAQFHVKDRTSPLLKWERDNDKVKAKIRATLGGTEEIITMATGLVLSDDLNGSAILEEDGTLKLYLTINGVAVPSVVRSISPTSYAGSYIYGKSGVYLMEDATPEHTAEDMAIIVMDKLETVHS